MEFDPVLTDDPIGELPPEERLPEQENVRVPIEVRPNVTLMVTYGWDLGCVQFDDEGYAYAVIGAK